ncbi:MAG TPA: VOC family protein [Thermoanaerobaculia bacterium]
MASEKPIPDGYETVTPYLSVHDGNAAIEFYKAAFGAQEIMRMPGQNGAGIGHADLLLFGRMHIMLADEHPTLGFLSPRTLGGSPVVLQVYVEDVDAAVDKAVAAGAKIVREVADQFYGDRSGSIEDPFGHGWVISTHKETLSADEMSKRAETTGH